MKERVQKIIARAGVASRREAEQMIREGRVLLNDLVITELGTKADSSSDQLRVDGKLIDGQRKKIYLLLNKPRGYVTTLRDPLGRPIVTDLLGDIADRLIPVGRLDYDSRGLLFLTNDGDFAQHIMHPRFQVSKTYRVKVKGSFSKQVIAALQKGVEVQDGVFQPEDVQVTKINAKSFWMTMSLREGKNRIIRRAISLIGRDVLEIIRIRIGEIELGTLPEGQYRFLTKREVRSLSQGETAGR